jgi:hypothetical protein
MDISVDVCPVFRDDRLYTSVAVITMSAKADATNQITPGRLKIKDPFREYSLNVATWTVTQNAPTDDMKARTQITAAIFLLRDTTLMRQAVNTWTGVDIATVMTGEAASIIGK